MKKIPRISRAKFENISYLTLNIMNMIIYVMILIASIMKAKDGTMADIMQSIYCTATSIFLILHEFASPIWIQIYFGFLNTHRGKGVLMLFLGCLVMCEIVFNIIVSILSITTGFTYFILSLVPTVPPPNSFLIHWQNHKDFWAEGLDLTMPANTNNNSMIIATQPNSNPVVIITNNNSNILNQQQYPHPSFWHPNPSAASSMLDMTKLQQNIFKQDNNYLRVY